MEDRERERDRTWRVQHEDEHNYARYTYFNDPGALGTRDSGTKLRPTGLPLLATGCGIPDGTVVCDGCCISTTPLEYGSDDEAAVYDRVMMPPTLPPCSSWGERIIVSSSSAESSR